MSINEKFKQIVLNLAYTYRQGQEPSDMKKQLPNLCNLVENTIKDIKQINWKRNCIKEDEDRDITITDAVVLLRKVNGRIIKHDAFIYEDKNKKMKPDLVELFKYYTHRYPFEFSDLLDYDFEE